LRAYAPHSATARIHPDLRERIVLRDVWRVRLHITELLQDFLALRFDRCNEQLSRPQL